MYTKDKGGTKRMDLTFHSEDFEGKVDLAITLFLLLKKKVTGTSSSVCMVGNMSHKYFVVS